MLVFFKIDTLTKDSLAQAMHQEQSSSIKAHQQEQEMLKKTTHKALEKEVKRKGGIMWLLIGVLVIGLVALGLWWRFR